jgi:hypothetical protein
VREKYCWLVADKPSEQGIGMDPTTMLRGSRLRRPPRPGVLTLAALGHNRRAQRSSPSPAKAKPHHLTTCRGQGLCCRMPFFLLFRFYFPPSDVSLLSQHPLLALVELDPSPTIFFSSNGGKIRDTEGGQWRAPMARKG